MDGKEYNYPSRVQYKVPVAEPIIIHFVSKPKPWNYFCKHPLKWQYYKYLKETPFASFIPKWNYADYKLYRLIPTIKKTIVRIDILGVRHIFKKEK